MGVKGTIKQKLQFNQSVKELARRETRSSLSFKTLQYKQLKHPRYIQRTS